jgi:hypothetical protein
VRNLARVDVHQFYGIEISEWPAHIGCIKFAGDLESRYRYSTRLVYNNYPWPESVI